MGIAEEDPASAAMATSAWCGMSMRVSWVAVTVDRAVVAGRVLRRFVVTYPKGQIGTLGGQSQPTALCGFRHNETAQVDSA